MFVINNETWFIEEVDPYDIRLLTNEGFFTIGSCDDVTKTIYINRELSDFLFRKVLCHEITHAAMFSYDVYLTVEQEELLADLIATYGEEIISITNEVFKKLKGRNK